MKNRIFILDVTDMRNKYLKKLLNSDGYMVFDFDENIFYPSGNFVYVFSPSRKVTLTETAKIRNASTVFAFAIDDRAKDELLLKSADLVNIMDDEIFSYKNAVLTAEGVLPILVADTKQALTELKVMVLGIGRLGKSVCELLKRLRVNVTPVVTTEQEECISCVYIREDYLTLENYAAHVGEYSVIINTIPSAVLHQPILEKLGEESVIIDLASKPGGTDFAYCERNGIHAVHALSLPAKYSPQTAGKYLKERLLRYLNKEEKL